MAFTPADFGYVLSVCALILMMPGPTNTLLFSSSLARGFGRALPLVAAELSAYLLAISCWGFLLLKLMQMRPWIAMLLKTLAALYIAWLSWKIWRFDHRFENTAPITARHVFIATLLNPKAFLFASFVIPGAAFGRWEVYLPAMATFTAALVPVSVCWCALGHLARDGSRRAPWLSAGMLLRGAALCLCFFSVSILYSAYVAS